MKAVINHEGALVTKPQEVLMEQANFYKKLYTSRQESASLSQKLEEKFIESKNIPRLSIEQKVVLDHPLTIEDFFGNFFGQTSKYYSLRPYVIIFK